jgi:putative ABC transport system permease protein
MRNNSWLVGSLFTGLLITVALVSSIPTYSNGTLQHLLVKNLESYQLSNSKYPGLFYLYTIYNSDQSNNKNESNAQLLNKSNTFFEKDVNSSIPLPQLASVSILNTQELKVEPKNTKKYDPSNYGDYMQVSSMSDMNRHIKLTDGRMPKDQAVNGVYEVIVPDATLEQTNITLGMVLKLTLTGNSKPIFVKPVGSFSSISNSDLYWLQSVDSYSNNFFMPQDLFQKMFINGNMKSFFYSSERYTDFDYHAIHLPDINHILAVQPKLEKDLSNLFDNTNVYIDFSMADTLPSYVSKGQQLKTMLWSLQVPVLILMGLYLFMVSRLIISRQQTEIAVLRSRGAGKSQIFLSYLIEFLILGTAAFMIGPYLGLGLSKMLGASNGFLEFVQRESLPVGLSSESYKYALLALLGGLIMMMIPVLQATRETIVSQKRKSSRFMGMAVWHKFFIDFLLLGIAAYEWTNYHNRLQDLSVSKDPGVLQHIDPLVFFVPILCVIGLGLLGLRFYPLLLKIINWIGHKIWPTSMYIANVQVGRMSKNYQFVMLFLIVTIGVGVINVSEARTINQNMEDQLHYATGADINLQPFWQTVGGAGTGTSTQGNQASATSTQYIEPPFSMYQNLSGVQHAAKVLQENGMNVQGSGKSSSGVELMGIDPRDFGLTAWFKTGLLPYHINAYLNLLARDQTAVLVSRSLAIELNLQPGDKITVGGAHAAPTEFVVYAIIDYWPSWNPVKNNSSGGAPTLIVGNLPFIQNSMGLEPYQVWLKLKPNASTASVYNEIEKINVPLISLTNAKQEVIKMKNDPFVQGLNGALTLGFLISIIVTFIGFLLYWILTLFSRSHQYGMFRAMGMSVTQLIGLMIWEQIMTSGLACFLGILAGSLTSRLFVPFLQLILYGKGQVPPFTVMVRQSDAETIYIFISTMVIIGLAILGWLIARIRIHQAVKLGED